MNRTGIISTRLKSYETNIVLNKVNNIITHTTMIIDLHDEIFVMVSGTWLRPVRVKHVTQPLIGKCILCKCIGSMLSAIYW